MYSTIPDAIQVLREGGDFLPYKVWLKLRNKSLRMVLIFFWVNSVEIAIRNIDSLSHLKRHTWRYTF